MADSMDLVQARVEEELQRNLANARRQPAGAGEFFCVVCDEEIPEARRRAVQGVTHCVTCQQINELKSAHYKGGAV
ncbi:TraR/DksA family transcriptional regulator [Pantoea allii]|uniref:TraR/DksA family transcriptional regulator n=1 Tax=Pantoea allii TaxID=574096 RepID=UPI0024B7E99B|nr:TraR/DksA family transcriptional regulator [Pantoea allii]MDJ0088225.1 TraR/DksA family transcriptional regulator [Pantoea allii]